MRIYLTVFLILIVSPTLFAQKIKQDVGDFNTIKVYDLIEVKLIKSDVNKVVIQGRNTDDVQVMNINRTLKLRMNLEERFDGNETYIEVYYTNIDVVDANEGAVISVDGLLEQNTIEFKAQEGGRIEADVNIVHIKVKSVTGGIIELNGKAVSQDVSMGTGGIYYAKRLITQDTEIKITAAGEAEVHATEKIKARVTAGGDITIYGNPPKIDKKTVAGGSISIVN